MYACYLRLSTQIFKSLLRTVVPRTEAFTSTQEEKILPTDCNSRRVKYLNNVIEQDHRFIKKKVRASRCFKRFHTAERTLQGIEAMNMVRKSQVKRLAGNDAMGSGEVRRFAVRRNGIAKRTRIAFELKNNFRYSRAMKVLTFASNRHIFTTSHGCFPADGSLSYWPHMLFIFPITILRGMLFQAS